MTDQEKLAIYEMVYGGLDDIEWSGTRRGQGSGPMGSGGDGYQYDACPVCGGLKEPNGEFIAEAVGHQPGCRLAEALGKSTRELAVGEQGEIAI